jgi:hypothetical protein
MQRQDAARLCIALPLWFLFCLDPNLDLNSCIASPSPFSPQPAIDSLVQAGLSQAYLNDYDRSRQTFDRIMTQYPGHPIGYLLKAGVLEMEMTNFDVDVYEKDFGRLVGLAGVLCDSVLKIDGQDPWARFFKGTEQTYRAAFDARRKRYVPALASVLGGRNQLNAALAADSTLYDAYLGLGVYDYFRTAATRFLNWLPFIGDNRKKGIREITIAAERARYVSTLAREALTRVLIEERRFAEAERYAAELLEEFPQSLTFSWSRAEIAWRQKDWAHVEERYRTILPLLEQHDPPAHGSIIYARHRIAQSCYERRLYAGCLLECEAIRALPLDARTRKRLSKELGEMDTLWRRAGRKLR